MRYLQVENCYSVYTPGKPADVSAVPMEANKKNYLLMYAMGPNVAGVIGQLLRQVSL